MPHVPVSIRAALRRALSKDPNDRFGTCSDFAGAMGCQLLNTPAPAPEILLETDVEQMTAGRLVRWVSFGWKNANAIHVVLTREAVWSAYHTEVRRWPLVGIERVEPRTGPVGQLEPAKLAEAELVRRSYRDAEANLQDIRLLNLIVVGLAILVSLIMVGTLDKRDKPSLITVGFLTAQGLLIVAVNWGLRRRRSWARWAVFAGAMAVLVSASGLLLVLAVNSTSHADELHLGMIMFSLTMMIPLAAYVAWTLLSWKTSVVFTSSYAEAVERTPHLNPRRSWLNRASHDTDGLLPENWSSRNGSPSVD